MKACGGMGGKGENVFQRRAQQKIQLDLDISAYMERVKGICRKVEALTEHAAAAA